MSKTLESRKKEATDILELVKKYKDVFICFEEGDGGCIEFGPVRFDYDENLEIKETSVSL
jgi:hypothetical protein